MSLFVSLLIALIVFSNHHEIMLVLIFTSKLPRNSGRFKKIIPYVSSHECEAEAGFSAFCSDWSGDGGLHGQGQG